ncbi:ACT domain-containing protein, partial [Paenibacillus sp. Aloe-11]
LGTVTTALGAADINIAYMHVDRKGRDGEALTAIEMDSPATPELIAKLRSLPHMYEIKMIHLKKGAESDAIYPFA